MNDIKTVREVCEHGRYETHPNISYGDVPAEDNCPGGKEIRLQEDMAWFEDTQGHKSKPWKIWVEVDGNE